MSWFKRRKDKKDPTRPGPAEGQDQSPEEEDSGPDQEPPIDLEAEPETEPQIEPVPEPSLETGPELQADLEAQGETPPEEPEPAGGDQGRRGIFGRFRRGLSKTRQGLKHQIDALFSGRAQVDEDLLEELEELLITADLGIEAATSLLEELRQKIRKGRLTDPDQVKAALKESFLEMLRSVRTGDQEPVQGLEVVLVVGVNGVGKTTTIGKLAHLWIKEGRKVLLAAGDTFRAAAGEQLEIWAERVGADIVRLQPGADPSAVVFDALDAALARKMDLVLVDTAGRLHTKVNLMEELKKIRRVMDRKIPGAPHQTLLVLDATTGQNAISQARLFNEATPLTGLVLTKLDGTAKGGIVAAVSNLIGQPVRYVGLGEQMEDLREFDPEAFVEAVL